MSFGFESHVQWHNVLESPKVSPLYAISFGMKDLDPQKML